MAETTPNNVAAAAGAGASRDAEANKPNQKQDTKKIVRLLTVVAYMMSVSMAALMLSAYYIFLWNPKEHRSGPLRLVDPCPDCYSDVPSTASGGLEQQVNMMSHPGYNDSQVAETPRVLPAKEEISTTPLSRLAQEYLDLQQQKNNHSVPALRLS